jgi:hypothetical protein
MINHYDSNEKIKNVLDNYIEKLNIAAGKLKTSKPKPKPKSSSSSSSSSSGSSGSRRKTKPYKGAQVEIRPLSKDSTI